MAVISILAQAHIGDHHQPGQRLLEGAHGLLHSAHRAIGFLTERVFHCWQAKQQHRRNVMVHDAPLASSTVWSTERWYCPGIEEISWRMPCPAPRTEATQSRSAPGAFPAPGGVRPYSRGVVGHDRWENALVLLLAERVKVVLQGCQDSTGPAGTHLGCQALAELCRFVPGATQLLAQELRAVRGTDQALTAILRPDTAPEPR